MTSDHNVFPPQTGPILLKDQIPVIDAIPIPLRSREVLDAVKNYIPFPMRLIVQFLIL